MDAIEKAIRNAFEKGNPSERSFREKVYRSAFSALDKALQSNPNVTQEVVARRRQALSATISQIESEFIPAVHVEPEARSAPVAPQPAPSVEVEPIAPPRQEPGPQPAAPAPQPDFEPALGPDDISYRDRTEGQEDGIAPPDRDGYRSSGRRRWLTPLVALVVLAAIVLGGWWAIGSGWLRMPADGTAPPQAGEDAASANGDQAPRIPGGADDLREWIVVFEPSDPTTVAAPGDTSAEVMEDDGEQFMRITSGASGAPVLFDVGQGVLEQIAGGRAVFNIVAQASDGETEISVDCNLGELGDCGRKRYAVGATREEFLFEMELPDVAPGSGGTIAINPDIDGGGKSVDIHAIRVTAAE